MLSERVPLELYQREMETFQNYVKRTVSTAFARHMIPEDEILRLRRKDYSKQTFFINYPLLVKGKNRIYDVDPLKPRYWVTAPIYEDYYCCSQWHKKSMHRYKPMFAQWIQYINDLAFNG